VPGPIRRKFIADHGENMIVDVCRPHRAARGNERPFDIAAYIVDNAIYALAEKS
jgi:hypothetical protein